LYRLPQYLVQFGLPGKCFQIQLRWIKSRIKWLQKPRFLGDLQPLKSSKVQVVGFLGFIFVQFYTDHI